MTKEELTVSTIDEFIEMIQKWYADNTKDFATLYDTAVANITPIPEGTDPSVIQHWKDASIDDLCNFFKAWYIWNPDMSTGLQYIQKFSWLYYENEAGLAFVQSVAGYQMTYSFVDLNGQKMDSPDSLPLVKHWMEELGSKMDDYIIPEGGYKNFNEFFFRELKPGMRPISSPQDDSVVVSPADAIVNMIDDNLSLDTPLQVKTQKLNVKQLLDNSQFASAFEGGTAVSCILMPTVYHRYHAPVAGEVIESNPDVSGYYFGIKDFPKLINGGNVGYGYDYSVFEDFRRGYLIIQTEKYGKVAMIPVGLNTIASVIFKEKFRSITAENPVPITKGEEVGYFQYGGSLNILLFEKGCFPAVRIPQGQIIGTLDAKEAPKAQFSF
ncbi:phosphatidylserine decarboxylase [uncultured Psychroserpens sp.]|uniref:phosphatidylserine decarboxylase n=1 Tax=uncultured Psychroserpens sp. TaxID=255436 RepID=UPI0026304323|nr:phosphatidylserine decarboxylase [uncultured Psychroserpens sp.]